MEVYHFALAAFSDISVFSVIRKKHTYRTGNEHFSHFQTHILFKITKHYFETCYISSGKCAKLILQHNQVKLKSTMYGELCWSAK